MDVNGEIGSIKALADQISDINQLQHLIEAETLIQVKMKDNLHSQICVLLSLGQWREIQLSNGQLSPVFYNVHTTI